MKGTSAGPDWTKIDRVFRSFEPISLLGLLAAAADAPGGGHRLPSLQLLWAGVLRRPPDGSRVAGPKHLPSFLWAARRAYAELAPKEDWWPPDPRLEVRFPIGPARLRLHPGLLSNPVAVLRTATGVADAIDRPLDAQVGFRLSDLIEVVLRFSDWRLGLLARVWSTRPLPRDVAPPVAEDLRGRVKRIQAAPVRLTKKEVNASRKLLTANGKWIKECADPLRAARVWVTSRDVV